MQRRNSWLYPLGLIALLFACALPARADLPPDLKGQDFGGPDQPGSYTTDKTKGTITVVAGGNDIWGTSDQGFFVFKESTGDGSVTMRFLEKLNHAITTPAKSGPMMRATIDPDQVSAFVPFQGDRFVDPHFRFETGGPTTNFDIENRGHAPSPTTPLWQRLERQGNRFSGLISDDGKVWNSLVSVLMPNMPPKVLAGLGACKHQASGDTPVTVVYDNFSIGTDLSPQNVVALAQDKSAMVMWDAVTGADGYNVYTQAAGGALTKVTTAPTKNTFLQLQNLDNGKPATVVVSAVQGGKEGIGVETVVTPAPPIMGTLQGVNINTIQPGTATIDAKGVITMNSAGHAMGIVNSPGGASSATGISDGFYFLAMPQTGDATATVRVVTGPDATRDDDGRQAALMFRESLDQDARFVMMDLTSGSGAELQSRAKASDAAQTTDAALSDPTLRPVWLRVVRKGSTFTGFISEDKDGKTFRQVGNPVTINGFAGPAYVGLGLDPQTGFNDRPPGGLETAQATFDNLTIK
jgi:hypothetical protein